MFRAADRPSRSVAQRDDGHIDIIFFIFIVGGSFGVLQAAGAVTAALKQLDKLYPSNTSVKYPEALILSPASCRCCVSPNACTRKAATHGVLSSLQRIVTEVGAT